MLAAPFLPRWTYTRTPEHVSSGARFAPPARDANAPDLYVPAMAALTAALLRGIAASAAGTFTPDVLVGAVSGAAALWAAHGALVKASLSALGVGGAAPLAEVAAYAGYPFVHGCFACVARGLADAAGGASRAPGLAATAVWLYASAAAGVFLVRTLKRVIFTEARQYSE